MWYTNTISQSLKKVNSLFTSSLPNQSLFLALFRVSIAVVALTELLSIASDFRLFFSDTPALGPIRLYYLESGYFSKMHNIHGFLVENGIDAYLTEIVIIYAVFLIFLGLGFLTRFSAVVALLLQLFIYKSFASLNYGYDYFLTMSLFYCFLFPVGKYSSIDSILFGKKSIMNFNYRLVLQLHLSIAYFYGGLAKALDPGWRDGNSVWKAMVSVENDYYLIPPLVFIIIGVGTVILEMFYPVLIYFKKTRPVALYSVVLMHVGIAMVMNLYAFSMIMIVWNVCAFGKIELADRKQKIPGYELAS